MKTKIDGSVIAAAEPANCKKVWVKPEVEMISNDLVKGGPLAGLNELSTVSFRHGQMS